MNRAIRRVGYAVTVVILVLVGQLTYLQVVDASNLANDPNNMRKYLQDYQPAARRDPHRRRPDRGAVAPDHRRLKYPARLPAGRPVRGHRRLPVVRRSATPASRRAYDRVLTGRDAGCSSTSASIVSGKDNTGNVVLSQTVGRATDRASDALEGQKGSRGRARREDRRGAGDVLEPDLRPQPARRPRHREGEHHVHPAQHRPGQACAATRVPRAVSRQARRSRS